MPNHTPRVVHLSSVHARHDTRVFIKMCSSVAEYGYETYLVVADGKGDELVNGVNIIDVGSWDNRFHRIHSIAKQIFHTACLLNADLYHLHDPELIPFGCKLVKKGFKVIFDSHEDVPKQILGKPYLNKTVRWGISNIFSYYEGIACAKLSGVIGATPTIRDKFRSRNENTENINNFPLLGELSASLPWSNKRLEVCYVGGVSKIRGIVEMCCAMGQVKSRARLNLVGGLGEGDLKEALRQTPGWDRVNLAGFLDREGVRNVLQRSIAGLLVFHPVPNHVDAQPNKLFEYMSAGIPVIASDFPLWRDIIAHHDCGLLVDPLVPESIAESIDYLVTHRSEAERMGNNGRLAVEQRYNWESEKNKMFSFYERTMSRSS